MRVFKLLLYPIAVVLLASLMSGCNQNETGGTTMDRVQAEARQSQKERAAAAMKDDEAQRADEIKDCKANLKDKKQEYMRLMKAREYWPAAIALNTCSELLGDVTLKGLVADAEIRSYVADIQNPRIKVIDRTRAAESFARDYPKQAKKYEKQIKELLIADALARPTRQYPEAVSSAMTTDASKKIIGNEQDAQADRCKNGYSDGCDKERAIADFMKAAGQ